MFGGFLPIREFFTHMETSLLPDLYSAPNVIEQWGSLTQDIRLLWSFPRTSDTHIAERSTVKLSLLVLTTWVCNNRDLNIQPSEWEANALIDCATAATIKFYLKQHKIYNISSNVSAMIHVFWPERDSWMEQDSLGQQNLWWMVIGRFTFWSRQNSSQTKVNYLISAWIFVMVSRQNIGKLA